MILNLIRVNDLSVADMMKRFEVAACRRRGPKLERVSRRITHRWREGREGMKGGIGMIKRDTDRRKKERKEREKENKCTTKM